MTLKVKELCCGYGNKLIMENVSFELKLGEILCLLGPNGVGKTTFFKCLLGFIPAKEGEIILAGKNIKNISRRELAKKIAYVPQAHSSSFAFKVFDVVLMGRTAYSSYFSSHNKKDEIIAYQSLEELGITHLANKPYTEISGGERQMVLIARALAQKAKFLIMDEPTSNLDFGNQVKVLNQIKKLSKKNIGIIMTTHSPDHVFLCATKAIVFDKGKLTKVGTPEEVVTETMLKNMYQVNVKVEEIKMDSKVKVCVPYIA